MKYLAILAVLLLAACAPSGDPDALRAEAARIERATARADAEMRAAQVQQAQATEAARMATEGAAQLEIDAMGAQAEATVTAIYNQQAALDLALIAGQATQSAWASNLHMTQTMAPVQATQTVQPTAIEAAKIIASARADRATNWTMIYPILLFVLMVAIIIALTIFLRWMYRRSDIDLEKRRMQIEIDDRKNGAFISRLGIFTFRDDGQLIDRASLNIPELHDELASIQPMQEFREPTTLIHDSIFDYRARAIDLLERSIELNGEASNRVASWSALDISSENWQRIIEYLKNVALIYTIPNKGTYTREGMTLADVIYRLEETSPTPIATVRG